MAENPEIQPQKTPHIAILPTPGMGHLIPLVEFAKKLAKTHNFSATFVIPGEAPPSKAQISVLDAVPPAIDYVFLPPVNFDDLPETTMIETKIALTVVRSLPSLRESIKSLAETRQLVAVVVDLFGTDAFDVAKEFNVSSYVFFPSTMMCLSLFFHLPLLDKKVSCEYRELDDPIRIPGCIPIRGKDLLDPVQNRKDEAYKWVLHHASRYRMAEGVIVNSFVDLEPGPVKALREEPGLPPVYPVGPFVRMGSGNLQGSDLDCIKWLDQQPHGSVLFVSFGSGGTLSHEQLIELAFGLEMSEQRFLLVVRSPKNGVSNGSYFKVYDQLQPFDFLPEGFLERTKNRAFVVASWAPQAQILSHGSTGGFLSHCGWNSSLEAIAQGVPLIAWPLFAEQKMNTIMLTENVKVALTVKKNKEGIVEREEVSRVIKDLMEGEEGKSIRNRMRDMKDASRDALSEDGSSFRALSEVAQKLKGHMGN